MTTLRLIAEDRDGTVHAEAFVAAGRRERSAGALNVPSEVWPEVRALMPGVDVFMARRVGQPDPAPDREGSRFWLVDYVSDRDGNSPTGWLAEGVLVGVVDEETGGIVAYCHRDMAPRIVEALAVAAGER